jgi:hypothetical protein
MPEESLLSTADCRPEPLMEDGELGVQCLACGGCKAARRLAQAFSRPDTLDRCFRC